MARHGEAKALDNAPQASVMLLYCVPRPQAHGWRAVASEEYGTPAKQNTRGLKTSDWRRPVKKQPNAKLCEWRMND